MSGSPESVGRYQIRSELGRGMMGVVYLAHDPDLSRDIALKVIRLPGGASAADRSAFERRFFAEARSAARLSHPGIVIVHDVGRDSRSGSLFMALQLLEGQTLDGLLKRRRRLGWTEALRITERVAEALHHAHAEGVVHRDIKPANIMILPNGDPKIMDFGIARLEASRLTATGQFIGTPMYMSPEQAQANPVDGRSDIFSLGSVLYEMLTGVPAFGGESITKILLELMSHEPAPLVSHVPSLPDSIELVLRRCLAKNVEERYQDAGALARDVRELLGDEEPQSAPTSPFGAGPGDTTAEGSPLVAPTQAGTASSDAEWWTAATRWLGTERTAARRSRLGLAIAASVLVLTALVFLSARLQAPPVARLIVPATDQAIAGNDLSAAPELSPTPEATVEADQPAELLIDFEHSLKTGVFRIFIDDLLVVDQSFGGRVTRRIVGMEMRKGRLIQTLEVLPGKRNVRVQVSWDDNVKTERSQTFFNPGGRLKLKAKVTGLRKGLSIEWN
jgi:hypothetical protein